MTEVAKIEAKRALRGIISKYPEIDLLSLLVADIESFEQQQRW
jgi:hypothetical protein